MDDFSPMIMIKALQPPNSRSRARNTCVSDAHISIMGCSHSYFGSVLPLPVFGWTMCSVSYAPVFRYETLLESMDLMTNPLDEQDRQLLQRFMEGDDGS